MRKTQRKLAVIAALRANPDFSQLQFVIRGTDREFRGFLRWLDQSGLALYLLWRLQQTGELENAPSSLRAELQRRLQSNRARTEAMFSDFRTVSEHFLERQIPHAILKGFTLSPDFCPGPEFRHQADIDVLIPPEALDAARSAALECGYSIERKVPREEETHFSTPLVRIPSADDDIYSAEYQKQLELHTSLWETSNAVSIRVPADWLDRARLRQVDRISCVSLSQEHAFLLHILHAFRHFLASWIRLSWLWEIDHFIALHRDDTNLWQTVRRHSGDDPVLRDACGLILLLANQLFERPIPEELRKWCVDPLPDRIRYWVAKFGIRCALSEISGNKLTLLIHKEFIREPASWGPYLWRRILPFAGNPSLVKAEPTNFATTRRAYRFKIRQRLFQARRLAFHASSLVSFSLGALRWRRALIQAGINRNPLVAEKPNHVS